jgi:magnesium-transporting ATPase (P-type)
VRSAEQRGHPTSVEDQPAALPPPNGQASEAAPGPTPSTGLTDAEAARRRTAGQGNDVAFAPSRSLGEIVRDNAFMSINIIIFTVGIALLAMGLVSDAVVTVGLVLMNVVIAVGQEWRAKRALDRIALLARVRATVSATAGSGRSTRRRSCSATCWWPARATRSWSMAAS